MRDLIVIAAVSACALLLQTTLLPSLALRGAIPNLLVVLVVYLGLHHHSVGGALGAFTLGYVEDSVSGPPTGMNAFGMCLVFMLVYLTSRRLWVDNLVSRVVVVFLASMVKTAGVASLVALFLSIETGWSILVRSLLFQAILAAAVAPPMFALLGRTMRARETETS